MSNSSANNEGFLLFKQFLLSSYGILLNEHQEQLLVSKLNKIFRSYKIDNFDELMMLMTQTKESALRADVIDAITINETSWYRDCHPFEILKKIILPEIHRKRPTSPLRIWSAACSYGQEPYSISMTIEEVKKMHPTHFVMGAHITATDISEKAISYAEMGEYEDIIMNRGLPEAWRKLFFDEVDNKHWRVKETVKNWIDFQVLNLMDDYNDLGKFDVIYCCNVLVYFSAETKKNVLKKMHAALKPGGYLVVGAREVLSDVQECYQIIQCNPGIIYRAIEK